MAEWVEATVDPKSPKGWQSEIAVGRLRLNGLVSLDAGYLTPHDIVLRLISQRIGKSQEDHFYCHFTYISVISAQFCG